MTSRPHFLRFIEQDLEILKSMVIALYAEDNAGKPMSEARIEKTVRELSAHPEKGQIIIFFVDETVVGYAIIIHFWSNEFGGDIAVLDEMYVLPQWRNQGVGTAFLAHISSGHDITWHGLQVEVTPENQKALEFYTRHGFRPILNQYLFKSTT